MCRAVSERSELKDAAEVLLDRREVREEIFGAEAALGRGVRGRVQIHHFLDGAEVFQESGKGGRA